MARVIATAPHSMFVEQAISCYDLMMTEQACHEAQLTIIIMTVKVNMPPVSQFDMRKALAVWTRRDRRARQSLSSKYTDQEYFVGFFSSTHSTKTLIHIFDTFLIK